MAKVHRERFAPDAKVANVKDRQVTGQRQDDRLLVVPPQRILLAVLVGDADALGGGLLSTTHPELGV